jgi:carbonic anhydrase/acetyltransferase-like protein (isoleucine patch superfamily)
MGFFHGNLHAMGDGCVIQTNVTFTDPSFVQLGHNVHLSGCTLFGHDGSVNMLTVATGKTLDRVGPVVVHDNVFIGHQAIVMPGVTVGSMSIVAAGSVSALEKLAEDPPAKARVRQLATAGAFHTHYMASALDGYAAAAEQVSAADPATTLLSNFDGQPVTSAADAMEKLVAQLTRPVRWDLCTETMRKLNTSAIVEFPPAGALTGIAKRELRGVATHAVKTPADLDGVAGL